MGSSPGLAVGAITIGQSPRPDLADELRAVLGSGMPIVEQGALDDLTPDAARIVALATEGPVLVTRLRDGTAIKIGEAFLAPRLQLAIDQLQDRTGLILLLCTGSFPAFRSRRPILYAEHALPAIVRAIGPQRIGILTPAPEQQAMQLERWGKIAREVVVEVASPYGSPAELRAAADRLGRADVELVVMDCIGYTRAMKAAVRDVTGRPALQAISVVARLAAEMVGA